MAETVRVILRSASAESLRDLLRAQPLDLNCGGPRREADGSFTVEAFVPRRMVTVLRKQSAVAVTVDGDFVKRTAERQREVGSGNRFRDGRQVPSGPGRKK